MKKVFFSLLLSFSLLTFLSANDESIAVSVDVAQSNLTWKAYKVTGSHEGTVPLNSGELIHLNGQLTGGSFDINLANLAVTDLEGNMKGKLEGHLKSADFFSVEEFPTATLNITNVASRGKAGEYKITADLTIKGITNSIKFNAIEIDGVFTADIKVDRSDYNVRYGSGSFFENLGDKTIYDEFDLSVSVVTAN